MKLFEQVKHKYAKTIKRYPRVYDFSRSWFRYFRSDRDEVYKFLNIFFETHSNATVLQIGANDGIRNDPIREFIVKYRNVKALLIEPVPSIFEELVQNYKYLCKTRDLSFLNAAIGAQDGEILLWKLKKEANRRYYDFVQGMVSFQQEHFLKYVPAERLEKDLESITVPQFSIKSMIAKCNNIMPNLVVIDVEGYERYIIENYPFQISKPKSFIYESVHLSKQDQQAIERRLIENNYSIRNLSYESIAILKEKQKS